MTSIWFTSPAFQRYALSRIVFEQRRRAIEKLEAAGYSAGAIVIADDDNLEIAKEMGFVTVERDNEWLGRRFNDGYEVALKEGADYVFPVGSDSWCDPQFIIDALQRSERCQEAFEAGDREARHEILHEHQAIASRHYTRFDSHGAVRRQLWVPVLQGVTYGLPRKVLLAAGGRPCQEQIRRGCDGSTWQRLTREGVRVVWSESHKLETTSFESWPQITAFEKLGGRWGRGDTRENIWAELRPVFGDDLVDKVIAFYEEFKATRSARSSNVDIDKRVREISRRVLTGRVPTALRQKARPYIEEAVRIALEEA